MVVRKPVLRENADLTNDAVLDGDGSDVKTGVLDEDETVADINSDDTLDESGGEDTGEDLENIDSGDLDSLLNESDDDEDDDKDGKKDDLDESNPIDNLGDKKAPPFTAEDAKEARGKKEAEGDGKEDDKDDKKDESDDKDDKDGKDDKDLKEDFVDPAEVIEPTLYSDDEPIVEEFGEIPDVVPEYPDEPIVELEGDDDVITEVDLETGVTVPSYDVATSFVLPESKNVVVSKGDRIYFCGKVQKDLPSFAESTFAKAAKMLAKNKNLKGTFIAEGKKSERVAVIGRSCLVEVTRDWRLPGTDTIFEKGDIIQIVSRKQITEKEVKTK